MKRRLTRILIILILILISIPLGYIFLNDQGKRLFTLIYILVLTYLLIYTFGGLSKLIIYSIYGAVASLLILLLPAYEIVFIAIITLVFILNPLANLELFLIDKFKEIETGPIELNIHGTKKAFFDYRKDMKETYHLPQVRKLLNHKYYPTIRKITVLLLIAIGIFLIILELSNMTSVLTNFDFRSFFTTTYGILFIVVLAILLYKKGFTSTFRAFVVLIFPPMIYLVFTVSDDLIIQSIFGGALIIVGLIIAVSEYNKLKKRVIYESYTYYDHEQQQEVYANALYEPYVYDDYYKIMGVYEIHISRAKFMKRLNEILVYANNHHFFITAYTFDQSGIKLYTNFHEDDQAKTKKLFKFLETLYQRPVFITTHFDQHKTYYETEFFHKTNYIIARALYLADILRELDIKQSHIIVSFTVWFQDKSQVKAFGKLYKYQYLDELSNDKEHTISVDMQVSHIDYLIEQYVRDFLLNLMIFKGKYVRVNIFY